MSKEYFELAGALLGVYGVFRTVIWFEFRDDFRPVVRGKKWDGPAHWLDTSKLSPRLEELRRDYTPEARVVSASKPMLVEERRAEIAKLAFFQRPPTKPEPPEHEQGMVLLAL